MISKSHTAHSCFLVFLLLVNGAAMADSSPRAIGLVKGSTNTSIGGESLLPDTTLFSGDRLEVNDGVAVVALGGANRMTFHPDTVASFVRDSDEVTVLLGEGAVSWFHGNNTPSIRVRVGAVTVTPVSGYETLGEVVATDGVVTINAKDGRLRVEHGGQIEYVAKGKTLTLAERAGFPQAAKGSSTPKPPLVSPPSAPQSSSLHTQETSPFGSRSRASVGGPSQESTANAAAPRAPLDTAVPAPTPLDMVPIADDAIGGALWPLRDCRHPPSPYEPYFYPPGGCRRPPSPPRPHPHPRHRGGFLTRGGGAGPNKPRPIEPRWA